MNFDALLQMFLNCSYRESQLFIKVIFLKLSIIFYCRNAINAPIIIPTQIIAYQIHPAPFFYRRRGEKKESRSTDCAAWVAPFLFIAENKAGLDRRVPITMNILSA